MRAIYFMDEVSEDHGRQLQDEATDYVDRGWVTHRVPMPFDSLLARRQWCKEAEGWLKRNSVKGWACFAYLADGTLWCLFEDQTESRDFATAAPRLC